MKNNKNKTIKASTIEKKASNTLTFKKIKQLKEAIKDEKTYKKYCSTFKKFYNEKALEFETKNKQFKENRGLICAVLVKTYSDIRKSYRYCISDRAIRNEIFVPKNDDVMIIPTMEKVLIWWNENIFRDQNLKDPKIIKVNESLHEFIKFVNESK